MGNLSKIFKKAAPILGGAAGFMIGGPSGAALGYGLGSSLTGKANEKQVDPNYYQSDIQRRSATTLGDYFEKYAGGVSNPYEAYGGDLTPGFAPNLDNPDIWGVGEGEIRKTLEGGYDPYSSDYYKSMREGMFKEQDVAANRLAGYGQKVGAPQSATMGRLEQLGTDTTSRLGQVMAELGLKERQNKLSMIPYASSYGANRVNLDKYNQENKFNLQDTALQRKYQEWLRRKEAESGLMSMINQQGGGQFMTPGTKESSFSKTLGMGTDLLDLYTKIKGLG